MSSVSVRDLRNNGGEVLNRVVRGEHLIVTRDGAEVAELRPLRKRSASTADLVGRRRALPVIDVQALRNDIDALIDPEV